MGKIKGKLSKKKSRYSKGRSKAHTKRRYKRVNSKGRKKKKTSKKKKLRGGSSPVIYEGIAYKGGPWHNRPLDDVERKALRKLINKGDQYCGEINKFLDCITG